MIDYNEAIRAIKDNNGFKPNKKEDSFYRTYTIQNSRPIQIRISNHGTHLWTWYDKDYDPSYAINICVVFSEDGCHSSDTTVDTRIKDEQGNIIGERKPFEVKQFVYNCQNLDNNDAALINMEIQNTWKNGGFQDPLAGTPKQANVIPLRTNNNDNNTDIKKENIMRNKRTYRLTESKLRGMIREAVKSVINESVSSTAADKLIQCERNVNGVLNTIKNNVIELIDSIKDGTDFRVYSKIMNDFKYSYPQMINDCYKPIIDEYIQSSTEVNNEDFCEPEDWYERNEHGDFDTY